MLTEEAHHMFVGETGVLRVVERTAQQMAENKQETRQVRKLGLIDLPTMQKYLNLWYSLSLDLFGGEISSNAATYFATGMKGRAKEDQFEDHKALEGVYGMDIVKDGKIEREEVPLRNAMNEVLRDAYVEDCQRGVDKWNRAIAAHGIPLRAEAPEPPLPPPHRHLLGHPLRPGGQPAHGGAVGVEEGRVAPVGRRQAPTSRSLMPKPVFDPKQMANWIAAPKQGIKGRAVDFEYVRREA